MHTVTSHFIGCKTISGPKPGVSCVFPFTYKGKTYRGCTTMENNGVEWCSTKTDNGGAHVGGQWGNCDPECHKG